MYIYIYVYIYIYIYAIVFIHTILPVLMSFQEYRDHDNFENARLEDI